MCGNRHVQGMNGIPSTMAKSNFNLGIFSKIVLSANILMHDLKNEKTCYICVNGENSLRTLVLLRPR